MASILTVVRDKIKSVFAPIFDQILNLVTRQITEVAANHGAMKVFIYLIRRHSVYSLIDSFLGWWLWVKPVHRPFPPRQTQVESRSKTTSTRVHSPIFSTEMLILKVIRQS